MKARRHHRTQRPAVGVFGPAVGTDESQLPPIGQQRQRTLDERHVQIGPVKQRGVELAVLAQQRGRNQLLPHIGRVAHHHIKAARQRVQQKVARHQPRRQQPRPLGIAQPVRQQQRVDFLPGGVEGAAVQLHRADAIGQVSPATRRLERTQQPPHGSQHKRTAAKRRLQQAHAVQRLAGGVPGQIEHELHHLGPGVDRPPPVSVRLAGERVHGIGYGAEALEGGLVGEQGGGHGGAGAG